ncbi:MAG: indolepyruvate oxidoreductase subunit beta [Anaerolineales bacterium]|nr:indolepyruvate oxidoreductase subunit beta [Anaerolineales bacterium]
MKAINFLVVGVGGQGALLASNVLAEVGVRAGFDVKKAEVHGMSQRGGSVNSHVRWGEAVKSPLIGPGEADVLFSLEKLETLRYLDLLRKDGLALIGEFKIPPLTVSSGQERYPDDEQIEQALRQVTRDFLFVPTLSLAAQAGTARAHNVVMLGALSARIEEAPLETWLQALEELVPQKYVELNRRAFELGRGTALPRYETST